MRTVSVCVFVFCVHIVFVCWLLLYIQIHSNHMSSARNCLDENTSPSSPSPPWHKRLSHSCAISWYQNNAWPPLAHHAIPETRRRRRRRDADQIIAPFFFLASLVCDCVCVCVLFIFVRVLASDVDDDENAKCARALV